MIEEAEKKKLYDAVVRYGDSEKVVGWMNENPNLVGEVSFARSRNVLHFAAMHGHENIVEVLRSHRQLARDLDSQNSTPLHIAAAYGRIFAASKLLSIAPETCWWRDCHGMNPVHVAAVNGCVNILEEMFRVNSTPFMERVHSGDTLLHLCIKHDRLEALQFLVDKLGDFVCAKNDDGDTILHLAVRFNQPRTIQYLVEDTKIKKQARNSMGKTALQIWSESPDIINYSEMEKLLKMPSTKKISKVFPNLSDMTMVVVGLIATMAFQAAISPPGGVWQEDTTSHKAGDAVMAYTHPKLYKQFVRANNTAFVSSIITIFLITTRQPSGRILFLLISLFAMWVSLASIALSYGASITVASPSAETQSQSLVPVIIIVVVVSLGIIGFIFLYNIIREWYLHRTSDPTIEKLEASTNKVLSQVRCVVRGSESAQWSMMSL